MVVLLLSTWEFSKVDFVLWRFVLASAPSACLSDSFRFCHLLTKLLPYSLFSQIFWLLKSTDNPWPVDPSEAESLCASQLTSGCWKDHASSVVAVQALSHVRLFETPHGPQHARLLCPQLSPGVCLDSYPLSQWCYLTISLSATPFSCCLQSFLIFYIGES